MGGGNLYYLFVILLRIFITIRKFNLTSATNYDVILLKKLSALTYTNACINPVNILTYI